MTNPLASSKQIPGASFRRQIASGLLPVMLLAGCTASHYKKSADHEVYQILQSKQQSVFGQTNAFTIDTPFSGRDPEEVRAEEILQERQEEERQSVTLNDALTVAVENNRQYQLRRENLYLSALTLTLQRYNFRPQFLARTAATGTRSSNGDRSGRLDSDAGVDQTLKTGGRIGLNIANDLLRFYTGDPRRSAVSTISVNLVQPLLRGAWAKIATENLTQAERNVIYETRSFSRFQNTFAFDVTSTYLRLVQQQDTVRNEYDNYQSLVRFREQIEDLAVDRIEPFQVDQARQTELSARSRYILTVEQYQASLDGFKITLGLPLGYDLRLDDSALKEIESLGLVTVPLSETAAYGVALTNRLDLLNEIDIFEDTKRRVKVASDRLKPDLALVSSASLQSDRPTDYANFDLNNYQASVGLQLDLPVDRLPERNSYRSALLNFERQIRNLALFLDNVRDSVRDGLRTLDQARQSYEIQKTARDVANRRVESLELLLSAGRIQVRDVLEARLDLVSANNAVTRTLVDYHLARLRLLLDMGILKTEEDQFWLKTQHVPGAPDDAASAVLPSALSTDLTPPDKLFSK